MIRPNRRARNRHQARFTQLARSFVGVLVCAVCVACGGETPVVSVQPTLAPSGEAPLPTSDIVIDPSAVPLAPTPIPDPVEPPGACAALDSNGSSGENAQPDTQEDDIKLRYDTKTNTIELEGGRVTSFAALSDQLDDDDLLREVAPGEWLLRANLQIGEDAEVQITAPEVRWLKLRSDASEFVWIKARGGELHFRDVCVTSWDEDANDVDQNYDDGRSFVLARDGAEMTIRNSELSYLGYPANESYGVAYRLKGTGGEIVDSVLGYNYYGVYTFEVSGLVIRGSEVHHSVMYGIDPHTDSRKLVIENNRAHHNGKHGIILAEGCSDSVIRNNVVYKNSLHGIVLYHSSNDNLVEGNQSFANELEGINVNESKGNTIRQNTVYGNMKAGIGVGQSSKQNTVVDNTVYGNGEDGIALYSDATDNTLRGNSISNNGRYGIYVKSKGNEIEGGHEVFGNQVGIYVSVSPGPKVSREDNNIYENAQGDIQTNGT